MSLAKLEEILQTPEWVKREVIIITNLSPGDCRSIYAGMGSALALESRPVRCEDGLRRTISALYPGFEPETYIGVRGLRALQLLKILQDKGADSVYIFGSTQSMLRGGTAPLGLGEDGSPEA